MREIARLVAVILCLVAQGSWAGVVSFQRLTDTIRLNSPTTLGTAATLEAEILYTSAYHGGQDLYREWVDSVEDKHLAVTPTGIAIELHDVGATLSTLGVPRSYLVSHGDVPGAGPFAERRVAEAKRAIRPDGQSVVSSGLLFFCQKLLAAAATA